MYIPINPQVESSPERESLVNLSLYSPSHICMWDHTNTHTTTNTAEGMAMARKKRPPYRSSCGRFGLVVHEINPRQDKTLLESFFLFLFLFIEDETDNWRAGQGRGVLEESRGGWKGFVIMHVPVPVHGQGLHSLLIVAPLAAAGSDSIRPALARVRRPDLT
jgi:hypothetical protein